MNHLLDLLREYRYTLLYFALVGETIGLPLPAEPMLVVAGALVALGSMHAALALLAVLTGDSLRSRTGIVRWSILSAP